MINTYNVTFDVINIANHIFGQLSKLREKKEKLCRECMERRGREVNRT